MKDDMKVEYKIFDDYPDLVNIKQFCSMLGGISVKTAYKILRNNDIKHFKIGRAYCIPKYSIILYLKRLSDEKEEC